MNVSEVCVRPVTTIDEDEGLVAAAGKMREAHVGSLVVVRHEGDDERPVGMLTDRDLVVEVLAQAATHFDRLSVSDVMTRNPVALTETTALQLALKAMRVHGIRRAPVVDEGGLLTGILTLDDMLTEAADMMSGLVDLVQRERRRETRWRE